MKKPLSSPALAFALLLVLLAGCDFSTPRSILDPAGPIARAQYELFMLTFWYGLGMFLVVTAGLVYAVWRYRRRPKQEGIPAQIHGEARLEAVLTIAPAILLVLIGIPTVGTIFAQQRFSSEEDALKVRVVSYQWWWAFEYPELGIVTANELHIPVGRRVDLALDTADVIHSFWVPRLAGKTDNIPNQTNRMWFLAEEPGVYNGHCAEYCGIAHAYMRFRVIADTEEDFDAWVASFKTAPDPPSDDLARQGAQLFTQKGCAGCHAIQGVSQSQVGPNLTNFGQRLTVAAGVLDNTAENLAAWLDDPQVIKPGNFMPDVGLTETEIDAMVAYLHSLGASTAERTAAGGGEP